MSYIVVYRKLLLTKINSNLYILVQTNYYITTQKHHLRVFPSTGGGLPQKHIPPPQLQTPLTTTKNMTTHKNITTQHINKNKTRS